MLTIWLVKMLGKKAFSICESASKSHCVSLQVASLLYVLHHGAFHVAFQHIHHSHGDADCGGSAPGTSECWGGAWCHQYYRQHHYWRKRVNRYLPVLVFFFFSFISDQNHWYILFKFCPGQSCLICTAKYIGPFFFFLHGHISFKNERQFYLEM